MLTRIRLRETAAGLVVLLVATGCGLSASQRHQIRRWEAEAERLGHPEIKYQEYLSGGAAAGLGFLPFGVAGFYVKRPGLGVSGILCWPLSILWVPAVASSSAHEHNYRELRGKVNALRDEVSARRQSTGEVGVELDHIDALRAQGKISDSEYQDARKRILRKLGAQPAVP